MGEALRHRGPDGDGQYRSGDVGMVQTRLAIIDLATGDQPLYEPGGAALIANGEIYNYLELRDELGERAPDRVFDPVGLRAAAAPLSAGTGSTSPGICAACTRLRCTIRRPAAWSWRATRSASSRSITPKRRAAFAFASEPGALIEAGIVAPQLVPSARNELVQMQFTTGPRDDLRRDQSGAAGRDGGRAPGADRRAPAPRGAARDRSAWRSARQRRSPGSTPPLPRACACISARTCRSACFSRAASIRPRCW